jgi:hypothetical protein
MAGKRQHFIPRFLQEGFASHTSGDATFTWVYRRDAKAFNSNIINVGVEAAFYTEGSDTQADDLITEAEGEFAALVRYLKTERPTAISDPRVPLLIAHLEVRTRHLRQSLLQTGELLVSRLLDFMADDAAFTTYLERRFREDPTILREAMVEALRKEALPAALLESMIQLSGHVMPALMARLRDLLPLLSKNLRSSLPAALKSAAKSGHIRGLKETLSPELRVQQYRALNYAMAESTESLVLGDSAILLRVAGEREYKPLLEKKDTLRTVILPLAPRLALVGASDGNHNMPAETRRALARCSLEYFIADEHSDGNVQLQKEIGMDAALLSQAQLEEIVSDLLTK